MSWLDRATKDPRPLYLIAFIILTFPLVYPIPLPVPVTPGTMGIYNFIKSMKSEDTILLTGTWGYKYGDIYPQFVVILEHCIRQGVRIVVFDEGTAVPTYTAEGFKETNIANRLKYGIDYVEIGYIPGGEAMVAGFCADFQNLVKQDYYGNPVSQLEITKNIRNIKNFKAVIVFSGGGETQNWLNQAYAPYGVPVGHAVNSAKATDSAAYFNVGTVFGYLNGLRGCAEYELLVNRPGVGLSMMGSVSLTHLLVIFALAIGSIEFLRQRAKEGAKK